jgi:hypothetical protein
MRWRVPKGAATATLIGLRRAGRLGREGGALWLGTRAPDSIVMTVVLPHGDGVVEHPEFWEMSTDVYARIGTWGYENRQVLLALVHSHRGPDAVQLSRTDQFATVHVIDFLSIVVGGYGVVTEPRRWGFHRFDGCHFLRLSRREVAKSIHWIEGPVNVLRCDANSIQEFA